MQILAKNIKRYRKAAGLTQEELGRRISYSGKAVSKWEAGHVFPPTEALLRLSEILQVNLDTLLTAEKRRPYYLGVDGGGTKTKFLLSDEKGKLLRQCEEGPCNVVNMSREAVSAVLTKGIASVCDGISPQQIYAFFGIAGAASDKTDVLGPLLKRFGFAAYSYGSDAQNIISAGLRGRDGIIAIMGTGSSIFSSRGGTVSRIGGYGHLLGDPASGYEIGKDALHAILAEADGSGAPTRMTSLFEEKEGRGVFDALSEFYKQGKPYIASFAPLAFEGARQGDAVAKQILADNIRRIAVQMKAARKQFETDETLPLVLGGGLTKAEDLLLPLLEEALSEDRLKLEILNEEPIMGALRLAKLSNKKGTEK